LTSGYERESKDSESRKETIFLPELIKRKGQFNMKKDEMKVVERNKKYNAGIKMIMDTNPLPETVKAAFVTVCHEPIEKAVYDKIIYEGIENKRVGMEDIAEMGAKLYYIQTLFNQKLNRCDHIRPKERDEFLLNCIVSEIKSRKQDFPDESKQLLKEKIYMRYCNMDLAYVNDELIVKDPDETYDDFDNYMEYLFKEERNGVIEIKSFNHLWNLLGMKRDQTFKKRCPSKNELYTFCVALALDYKAYCHLRKLLLQKMRREGLDKSSKYAQYLECERRDAILKLFLENIDTRLLIAKSETNGKEFVPSILVKNVNYDLEEKGFPILKIGRRKK